MVSTLVAGARLARGISLENAKDALPAGTSRQVFTLEQVKSLNTFQRSGVGHPYTCVFGRDENHLDGEGVLVATEHGWICPYCDYTQDWAQDLLKNWRWKGMFWRELAVMRMEKR